MTVFTVGPAALRSPTLPWWRAFVRSLVRFIQEPGDDDEENEEDLMEEEIAVCEIIAGIISESEWLSDIERDSTLMEAIEAINDNRYGTIELVPASIQVDALMAGLVSQKAIISKDAAPSDSVDRRVKVAVKCSFAASDFAIGVAAYSSYAILSLIRDFQTLAELMDQGEEVTPTMALMEQQALLLLDISFESLGAAACSAGSSVAARCHLCSRSWKVDAAQKALLTKIPLSGVKLFGPPLGGIIQKSSEDRKLMALEKGDRQMFFCSEMSI
ncbi:hypothetical protein NDU88_002521 [Pleurodeles waltl]|uniref:Lamina-associated polypeptide 2 alpha C-terminal domain-containing protein n=1 Tax=Pleurodeles waltl TaxID=8319 RepID=A0AAV7UZZ3_PLEWA|nr:hypothetical protein NDU88_002521 [Pleurodeles waltl]